MFGDLDWPLNVTRVCQHQVSFLLSRVSICMYSAILF